MVSECAFKKVVNSDAKFIVIDDELGAEFPNGDRVSVGFIERCFCDEPVFEIIKRGDKV